MAQTLIKNEKVILSGLAVCVLGLGVFFKQFSFFSQKSYGSVESQINYKMGKAEDQAALYDLNGRQIDREYLSDEPETVKAREIAKDKAKAKADPKKAVAAKAAPPKFAPTTAKAKSEAEAAQKAKALAKQNELNNQKKSADTKEDVNSKNFMAAQPLAETNPANAEADQTKKADKKTFAQYRQEFYTAGTKEAVMNLVTAYKNSEITKEEFYQLQTEALSQKDPKFVGLALYALRLTPSAESFSLMAQYQPSASQTYQEYIQSGLVSYNQSQYISILQTVLKSKQKVTVMKALEIIKYGLTEIKSGNTALLVDSRNRRDTQFSGYSVKNYSSLVAVINQVIQTGSPDSETLASLETVKGLISDSTVNVASN